MPLYLARHGETTWNLEGRLQGQRFGGELTDKGQRQADQLAAFATHLGLQRLLSSPLARARTTADRVALATGLPVEVHEALAEVDFGEASGLTPAQVEGRWPGFTARRDADRWQTQWPGGESYAQLVERARGFFAEVQVAERSSTLIVAHQTMNRALLLALGLASFEAVLASRQPSHVLWVVDAGVVEHHVLVGETSPKVPGLFLSAS